MDALPVRRLPPPDHSVTATDVGTSTRDPVIDAVRATAIIGVVFGHWTMAAITTPRSGDRLTIEAGNVLDLASWTHVLTWIFQVMPLFFVVGGFANAASWRSARLRDDRWAAWVTVRVRRLITPVVPMVMLWLVVTAATQPLLPHRLVHGGQRLASQPLWFLAVYLMVTAITPLFVALHERFGSASVLGWLVAASALDWARFHDGTQPLPLNFLFVWAALAQLGVAWPELSDNRHRWPIAVVGGYGALIVGTRFGPYAASMVGVGGGPSNMAPPTIMLIMLGVAQVGVLLALAPRLRPMLVRARAQRLLRVLGGTSMTLYLWHLTALAIGVITLAGAARLGLPQPAPLSALWWLTRPLWYASLGVVTYFLLRRFGRFEAETLLSPGRRVNSTALALLAVAGAIGAIGRLALKGMQPLLPAVIAVGAMFVIARALGPARDAADAQLDQTMDCNSL